MVTRQDKQAATKAGLRPLRLRAVGYRQVMSTPAESSSDADTDGQVSEVASFKDPNEEISPGDSVAGAPEQESGRADEGPTGPDAVTHDRRQDRHPGKDDVETTG
jgi:hypothetical protein